ncbi:hypothetical protein [Ureaplasma ceti]|uniref:Lipoprotein n=1 Tax=Ureaplasma ceti TaxID=3119530 RepID=A0ABP9UA47_9BACT
MKKKWIFGILGLAAVVVATPIALTSCGSTVSENINNSGNKDFPKDNTTSSHNTHAKPTKPHQNPAVLNNKLLFNAQQTVLDNQHANIGLTWNDEQAIPTDITKVNLVVNGNGFTNYQYAIDVQALPTLMANKFNLLTVLNDLSYNNEWSQYSVSFSIQTNEKTYNTTSKIFYVASTNPYAIGVYQDNKPALTQVYRQVKNVKLQLLDAQVTGVTFQWQQYINGVWQNIAGATNNQLTVTNADIGYSQYRLEVTSTTTKKVSYSNSITLTTKTLGDCKLDVNGKLATDVINTNPNQALKLSVATSNSNINFKDCTYQWQELSALTTNNVWQNVTKDGNAANYTVNTQNTYYGVSYRLIITNKDNPNQSIVSDVVNLNVTPTANFKLNMVVNKPTSTKNNQVTVQANLDETIKFTVTPQNETINFQKNPYTEVIWQEFNSGEWKTIKQTNTSSSDAFSLDYMTKSYVATAIRATIICNNNWRIHSLISNEIHIFIPMPANVQTQYQQESEKWIKNYGGLTKFLTDSFNETNTLTKIAFSDMIFNYRIKGANSNEEFDKIFANLSLTWNYTKDHYLQLTANNKIPLKLMGGSNVVAIPVGTELIWTLPFTQDNIAYTVNDEGLNSLELLNPKWVSEETINTDGQHATPNPFGLQLLNPKTNKTLMNDTVTDNMNQWGYKKDANHTIPFWYWDLPTNANHTGLQLNYLNSLLPNFYLNQVQTVSWNQTATTYNLTKNKLSSTTLNPDPKIANVGNQPHFEYVWYVQEVGQPTATKLSFNKASADLSQLINNPTELKSYQVWCEVIYKIGAITHTAKSPVWTVNVSNGSVIK